jgi:Lrp/AsnC ligand binding domain
MVSNAYVLVQTVPRAEPIARSLRTLPGVVFAEDVSGPYDALALAQPDGIGHALDDILEEIRDLPGVIRALAAPVGAIPAEAA